jgi:hypothetical protein
MKRYFEWLFPIWRYIRLRREVSLWRAALSFLMPPILWIALPLYSFAKQALVAPFPGEGSWGTLARELQMSYANIARAALYLALFAGAASLIEFAIAFFLVRRRRAPGGSWRLWQLVKYVALGCQTWAIAIVSIIILADTLGKFSQTPGKGLWDQVQLAMMTSFVILLCAICAASALQAARAVIILQTVPACRKCGYLLIGLTVPRCPECGTPFDPARLAELAQAARQEGSQR